ncbi:HNH endonuclease family protein [Actinacidiphila alni]|uniref:HNH endonuclease family protein n=1 Tax=Actinacidiphila alni TaxID=380248 RepID=UPI0034562FB0
MNTRTTRAAACAAAVLVVALAGCKADVDVSGDGPSSGGRTSASAPADNNGNGGSGGDQGRAVSPLDNPDGTKPGLAAITSDADKQKARDLIAKVAVKGRGPKTGYARDEFGSAWTDSAKDVPLAHNGCDTRNDLLKRDGDDVHYRSGSKCVVSTMTFHDPYTDKTIHWTKTKATTVQIDHVMPLSYDWQMGAAHWSKDKRTDIANDPLNLLPADGPSNSSKGDSGPASWLPPSKQIRCSYVVRFAQVSLKYDLPVTAPDKKMMLSLCGG